MSAPGPTPGSRCGVCNHARRAEIDLDVESGRPLATIGRRFGLSKHAMYRHVNGGHLPAAGAGGAQAPSGGTPTEMLRDALDALRAMDPSRMSASAQVARIDAIRRAAADLAKIEPPRPPDVVGVEQVRGLKELVEGWSDALKPFPEARAAMLDVTRRIAPELLA